MEKQISITFFSNYLIHHQTPFCQAMVKRIGDKFHFVATMELPTDRKQMGYEDYTNEPYAVNAYRSKEEFDRAMQLAVESDVVILGDAPNYFVEERLKQGKLTFRYNERLFKKGYLRILDPRVFKQRYLNDIRFRKANFHMLCASAYTSKDCRFIHSYPNKIYKWGYFPPVNEYQDISEIIVKKNQNSILWVGRLLDWKRPGDIVKVASTLKKKNIPFSLEIIGEGEMKEKLIKKINKKNLQNYVKLTGFMSPEQVREKMEKADIYLFTSDRNEGWGAVLNESMNSACAVVANKEIGSVPYLIKDGENGLIYNRKKRGDIVKKVLKLIEDKDLKTKLQNNAYKTLITTWNAESAADRLLDLIDCINSGKPTKYEEGPCSRD